MRSAVLSLLVAGLLLPIANAACECGYRTNTQAVFQYSILTDLKDISTKKFRNSADWDIKTFVLNSSKSRPIATNYTINNVNVADHMLKLTCSAYDASITNSILSAGVHTRRSDILYGSFRATFSISGRGQGVVGSLFFYANDTTEIDIELLTRDVPRNIHLTNQPHASSEVYMPDGLMRTDANNYRFDWVSGSTKFYINNVLSDTKTIDVPETNGTINLNSWGGSDFAGTVPPASDVTMSISGIQLYFNTSDSKLSKTWSKQCQRVKAKVCDVDNESLKQNKTATSGTSNSHGHGQGKQIESGQEKMTKTGKGMCLGTLAMAAVTLWYAV